MLSVHVVMKMAQYMYCSATHYSNEGIVDVALWLLLIWRVTVVANLVSTRTLSVHVHILKISMSEGPCFNEY